MKKTLICLFILLMPLFCFAAPSVTGVSGTWTHGEAVTISGSNFGTKSPAAPLMWDDAEGRTRDTHTALTSHGWDYVNQIAYAFDPEYKSDGFRNVSAAHSQSLQHIAFGHDYSSNPSNPANTMDVGMDAGSNQAQWFMICYYRLDPLFPEYESGSNIKDLWLAVDGFDESGDPHNYFYQDQDALTDAETIGFGLLQGNSEGDCDVLWFKDSPYDDRGNNPFNDWVHYEYKIGTDIGLEKLSIDNVPSYGYDEADCIGGRGNTRYITVGTYYRKNSTLATDDDAFRHYDDIYIDITLSRVMLANNSTYSSATIIEPQIPSAWATGEITVTVNQGAIPDGTAYLFVFDSSNDANGTGYEITLGDGEEGTCFIGGSQTIKSGSQTMIFK